MNFTAAQFNDSDFRSFRTLMEWERHWIDIGNLLRRERHSDTDVPINTPNQTIQNELYALLCFFRQTNASACTKFRLTPKDTPGCDAIALQAGKQRLFEVKTTGPLWPDDDGKLGNYGQIRSELMKSLGTPAAVDFGPSQRIALGKDYADTSKRMIPKSRLIEAYANGLSETYRKIRSQYKTRPVHDGEHPELIVSVWGMTRFHVSNTEFEQLVKHGDPPHELFRVIHVVGTENDHYCELLASQDSYPSP